MRTFWLAAAAVLLASPALAADPVEGEWLTQGSSGKVRIAPCAGKPDRLCGLITWLRDPADARARDANNPEPGLRSRPLIGLPMIRDFKKAAPGR